GDVTNSHYNGLDLVRGDSGTVTGWAVGDAGQAAYFDGTHWTLTNTGQGKTLYSVSFSSSGTAWAVGANGSIQRWDAGSNQWRAVVSPTTLTLNVVQMLSDRDGW